MTEAIEDRVVVENMVSCDKCREDGGYVDCNHICLGFVQIEGGRVSEVIEGGLSFSVVVWFCMSGLRR